MKIFKIFLCALFVVSALLMSFSAEVEAADYKWTAEGGSGDKTWQSIASSSDGIKLAACAYGFLDQDYIYTSTDSGTTWTRRTSAGKYLWSSIASSSDGVNLVAVGPYIYTSTDSGANWTRRLHENCKSVASSSDGTKLAVGTDDYIYTSTNGGADWTKRTSAGNHRWQSIASSSDGEKLVACVDKDYIYTSTDGGANWTPRTNAGSRKWGAVASSSDGTKLAAGDCSPKHSYIYTSSDSGVTWQVQVYAGDRKWWSIAVSSDGTKIAAGTDDGYIYTSADGGTSWTEQKNAGERKWYSVACSSDGTLLVACVHNGYIWRGVEFPSVTTTPVSDVLTTTAVSGGNVTSAGGASVTAKGVCWSTSTNPTINDDHTIDGTGTGSFTSNVTGLSEGTTYYLRAYATSSAGTSYGDNMAFKTDILPYVTTTAVTNVTATTAVSGGVVTSEGGSDVTARGVCWSLSIDPTTSDSHTSDGAGTGSFTSSITGLTESRIYYVRAYAINSAGTVYGDNMTFITHTLPYVTTTAVTNVTTATAVSGGVVTSEGTYNVYERGVCWSISINPTTDDDHTEDDYGKGSFTSYITGLSADTQYYVRAYATSQEGTAYGLNMIFITHSLPYVTTTNVSNITTTTAVSGGNVMSEGGEDVTARGVCWSTSINPTTSGSHTSDGTGTGSFTSNITGLTLLTTYYVRAYATNTEGTSYGDNEIFATYELPTITTTAVSDITTTTAVSGGNVTNTGGGSVIARGVCWSMEINPTTDDSHTSDGTGTGSFTSNITGLYPNYMYFVRAYATNSGGTAYGENMICVTHALPDVTTTPITIVTATTAISGGDVTDEGGAHIIARGVCWSTSTDPTTSDSRTSDGTGMGAFTSDITGLTVDTKYYARAYAVNSTGTAYGDNMIFITHALPYVTTNYVTDITHYTATSGGVVTSEGFSSVTGRGVCWSTTINPTTSDSHTSDGVGVGSFTSSITGLNPGHTYYARAYATNSDGTAYGDNMGFTTTDPDMWYLSEGSTSGFDTWILIQNFSTSDADVTITYMDQDGNIEQESTTIESNKRFTRKINDISAMNNKGGVSTVIDSTNGVDVVAERSMYWDGGGITWVGGSNSLGANTPHDEWYFAEGCTNGFNMWFLIQNPNGTTANITMTFMDESGSTVTKTAEITANSRYTVHVNSYTELQNKTVSTKIESTNGVGIIAERAMYWNDWQGGHSSMGAVIPFTVWYFAEGCTNGYDLFFAVQNPNDNQAECQITFMDDSGSTTVKTISIPATSRYTVNAASYSELQNKSISTKIESTNGVGIVAERMMYWGAGGIHWKGGHCSIGSTDPARTWYFAEGCTNGFDTWILVQNPNDSSAAVTITYMDNQSTTVSETVTIQAHTRYTRRVNDVSSVNNKSNVSIKVESTNQVEVVAERAMYWASGGTEWVEGHSSHGYAR